MKIGILGSGKGSNFDAIAQAIQEKKLQAEIAVVISDHPDALILTKAKGRGLTALYIAPGKYKTYLEQTVEEQYVRTLKEYGVEWIVLAGFMRVLKDAFFKHYEGRIINIHPSLLPSFKGIAAWRQALDWGVKVTGCTVHLVDRDIDTGPILLQEAVSVRDDDTSESLHARIQGLEHRVFPKALQLIAKGGVEVKGRRVVFKK